MFFICSTIASKTMPAKNPLIIESTTIYSKIMQDLKTGLLSTITRHFMKLYNTNHLYCIELHTYQTKATSVQSRLSQFENISSVTPFESKSLVGKEICKG